MLKACVGGKKSKKRKRKKKEIKFKKGVFIGPYAKHVYE